MDRSLIPMTVNYYCSQYLLNTKYNFLSYQSVAQVFIQVNQSHYLEYIYKKKIAMGIVDSIPCEQSLLRSSSISREEEGDSARIFDISC